MSSTTAIIKVVCSFDLQELDDWKHLCAMFKDKSCSALLQRNVVIFDLVDLELGRYFGLGTNYLNMFTKEEMFQQMNDFFTSVEPQLVDKVDLVNLHQQLLELCDKLQKRRFKTLPKDKYFDVELFATLGRGEIFDGNDGYRARSDCTTLAEHAESVATINHAFKGIGIPDERVTIKIDMHNG